MMRGAVGRKSEVVARAYRDVLSTDLRESVPVENKKKLLLNEVAVRHEAFLSGRHARQTELRALHADTVAQPLDVDLGVGVERMTDLRRVLQRQLVGADKVLDRVGHERSSSFRIRSEAAFSHGPTRSR